MRTLFYLSESQLERVKPFFPHSHGAPRVDDRREERHHTRHLAN